MEETIGTFLGLLCTIAPCLLVLGAIGGGIAFFVRRNKRTATMPPVTQPASPAVVQPERSERPAAATGDLTPSEVVALRGDLFAPAAGALNSWKIAGSEAKVSGQPLAQNMLAAAFLALERAGDAHLTQSTKKGMLGRQVDTVLVTPTQHSASWPAGSFEAKILTAARSRQASGRNNVNDIVFEILEQDAGLPWQWALQLAHNAMARRGLLMMEAPKGFLSGAPKYSLASTASDALTQASAAEAQQLLQSCAQERPGVFQLLTKEIKSGLDARTKSSSFDD
jgi:hypothetical protein